MHLKEELSKFFMAALPCETASRIFCSWSSTKTTTPSCLQSSPLVGPAWSASFDHPMPKLQTEAVNMYPISLGSGNILFPNLQKLNVKISWYRSGSKVQAAD